MPISLNQFLRQFSKQALDERVSLFLGAGGSREAGYPNWAELFLPIADDLGTPITETTDLYRLAQYYSNAFGLAELHKRINERINRTSTESPLKLDSPIFGPQILITLLSGLFKKMTC